MECDRTPHDDYLQLWYKSLNACKNGYVLLRLPHRHNLAISMFKNRKLSYLHVSPFRVIRTVGILV